MKVAIAHLSHAYRTPKPEKSGGQTFIGNHLDTALRIMLGDVTKAQPSLIDGYGGRLLLHPDTQHSSGSAAADEQGEQR